MFASLVGMYFPGTAPVMLDDLLSIHLAESFHRDAEQNACFTCLQGFSGWRRHIGSSPIDEFPHESTAFSVEKMVEIVNDVFGQVRMEGFAVSRLMALEKGIVFIEPAQFIEEILIDQLGVQGRRMVSKQGAVEVGLQLEGCVKIEPHFMGPEHRFHAFDDVFDFVPALFQDYIEEFPGAPLDGSHVDPAHSQEVQPPFVEGVDMLLVLP